MQSLFSKNRPLKIVIKVSEIKVAESVGCPNGNREYRSFSWLQNRLSFTKFTLLWTLRTSYVLKQNSSIPNLFRSIAQWRVSGSKHKVYKTSYILDVKILQLLFHVDPLICQVLPIPVIETQVWSRLSMVAIFLHMVRLYSNWSTQTSKNWQLRRTDCFVRYRESPAGWLERYALCFISGGA